MLLSSLTAVRRRALPLLPAIAACAALWSAADALTLRSDPAWTAVGAVAVAVLGALVLRLAATLVGTGHDANVWWLLAIWPAAVLAASIHPDVFETEARDVGPLTLVVVHTTPLTVANGAWVTLLLLTTVLLLACQRPASLLGDRRRRLMLALNSAALVTEALSITLGDIGPVVYRAPAIWWLLAAGPRPAGCWSRPLGRPSLEQLQIGVLVLDAAGAVVDANQVARELLALVTDNGDDPVGRPAPPALLSEQVLSPPRPGDAGPRTWQITRYPWQERGRHGRHGAIMLLADVTPRRRRRAGGRGGQCPPAPSAVAGRAAA